jgi:hypothetical protein
MRTSFEMGVAMMAMEIGWGPCMAFDVAVAVAVAFGV